MPSRSLHDAFDRNLNALNALRLLLAIGVISWHSFALTGRTVQWAPLAQILGQVWVDGFFAISGFLILGSWMNNPSPVRYLRARCLRILPAFYVCLIVTAAVIAPIGIVRSGEGAAPYTFDSVTYVTKNAALWIFQFDISGSPRGVPYPGAWNGSLWTLFWEFLCYVAVLVAGVVGLLRYRSTIALAFVGSWVAVLLATAGIVDGENFGHVGRFSLAFTAGALVYQYRRALPLS